MPEQAGHRRHRHLFYYLKVFDARTGRLLGHLVDMTGEGLMLRNREPLPVDRNFAIRMELPAAVEGQTDVVLEARSVWCRPDANPDYYGVGFRLIAVPRSCRSLLRSMITKFGFEH